MDSHREEFAAFGAAVTWLDKDQALAAFHRASDCTSKARYGLNDERFANIDRLEVEKSEPESRQWLVDRIGDTNEPVMLIFGKHDVCALPTSLFVDRWQDMFCPSRDDVVILPFSQRWALFYCHEDTFEFAR
jgi:hypothetical protein